MAKITLGGNECHTIGELPEVGSVAPNAEFVGADMKPFTLEDYAGKKIVLSFIPSIDTGVCAASARAFNERATDLDNTAVITSSLDLPFALNRFCEGEGIDNVVAGSGFRSSVGEDYNLIIADGGFKGLFSRAVVVLDENRKVLYTQQVSEIGDEPDYDAALEALA